MVGIEIAPQSVVMSHIPVLDVAHIPAPDLPQFQVQGVLPDVKAFTPLTDFARSAQVVCAWTRGEVPDGVRIIVEHLERVTEKLVEALGQNLDSRS